MVAKVDIHVTQQRREYMCAKMMVAKVDILEYTTQKEQCVFKMMVAKDDMIIESFDRICSFKNDGGEG